MSSNLPINKQIEKYNEPIINMQKDENKKGYSDGDNDSLDKLFNIASFVKKLAILISMFP